MTDDRALDTLRHASLWFEPVADGLQPLIAAVSGARAVLLGEASHGTHEFYLTGAEITKRLSHYFDVRIPDEFDAVLHIDRTSALKPLERWARDEVDLPETYPSGV
jgi:erythromycin esterase-like protein